MTTLKTIAKIHTGFSQKFGIPRQSNLVKSAEAEIIFEPTYRNPEFIKGLEGFDYIWLIWGFSKNKASDDATVRPPRLGGKKHMGVFATRAPFRPNNIGLSAVKIKSISFDDARGPVITVTGVDILDGTPIYDIKPYLPYADSFPDARGGFAAEALEANKIKVDFPKELQEKLPEELRDTVIELLKEDPRAAYDKEKVRDYRLSYAGFDIVFTANEDRLTVTDIVEIL